MTPIAWAICAQARPATRALALGIDLVLEIVVFLLVMVALSGVFENASEPFARGLVVLTAVLVFVGYAVTIETLTRDLGATVIDDS